MMCFPDAALEGTVIELTTALEVPAMNFSLLTVFEATTDLVVALRTSSLILTTMSLEVLNPLWTLTEEPAFIDLLGI